MTTTSTLIAQITAILGPAIGTNYSAASAANDAFEGYTFALVVRAARAAGATVTFEDNDGNATTSLLFRTSPGDIFSKKRAYTHALIELPDCPALEAHIGVKVSGKSKVLHECDVAVIERHEARICRTSRVHPRAGKVPIAIECKFYASTLQLGLARGYLGLAEELTKKNRLLVTNTTSETAAKMITYHDAGWEFDLSSPSSPKAADLEAKIKNVFRNYIATNKR
ncbi:hypothetical protein [Sphingomonas beigongshangi]|uniref:hypothetical protein n=1 Tax=Sphingomonas beigongshangi TaxID=2782540 RepID=UPI001AEEE5F6|nr:hypothetical protein [Sphingomonas beigongshangi]